MGTLIYFIWAGAAAFVLCGCGTMYLSGDEPTQSPDELKRISPTGMERRERSFLEENKKINETKNVIEWGCSSANKYTVK